MNSRSVDVFSTVYFMGLGYIDNLCEWFSLYFVQSKLLSFLDIPLVPSIHILIGDMVLVVSESSLGGLRYMH